LELFIFDVLTSIWRKTATEKAATYEELANRNGGRENPDPLGIGAHEFTLPDAFRCHSLFSILA
jgi:hypothetical protein